MGRPRKDPKDSKHRIVPVWNKTFDADRFASALLMLAMHLDAEAKKAHTKDNSNENDETQVQGGGDHEQQ